MARAQHRKKKASSSVELTRHAEVGGQTVHIDLCFVPWEHAPQAWLPAISGSSGHLVIPRPPRSPSPWPGQLFEQPHWSYVAAMRRYAQRTQERLGRGKQPPRLPEGEPTPWRQNWQARAERHEILQRRRQEDVAWQAERAAHHPRVVAYRALSLKGRAAQAKAWQAEKAHWAQRRRARRKVLAQRKIENQAWHARNQRRTHSPASVWIAILVVADDATRQCWGLPVFANGAHVTAQEVADALRAVLPEELDFLISDQGSHFRSKALAQLAQEREFVRVPIYRHRPQTNGIAERFVRTLKHELHGLNWSGPEELQALLAQVLPTYNDRPHQGVPIPGLSPNEFANRLWLM